MRRLDSPVVPDVRMMRTASSGAPGGVLSSAPTLAKTSSSQAAAMT